MEYLSSRPKMTRTEGSVIVECKPDNLKTFKFVDKTSKVMVCSVAKDLVVINFILHIHLRHEDVCVNGKFKTPEFSNVALFLFINAWIWIVLLLITKFTIAKNYWNETLAVTNFRLKVSSTRIILLSCLRSFIKYQVAGEACPPNSAMSSSWLNVLVMRVT